MSLMSEMRAYPVPDNAVAIWWLGQNGCIFKSPEGGRGGRNHSPHERGRRRGEGTRTGGGSG